MNVLSVVRFLRLLIFLLIKSGLKFYSIIVVYVVIGGILSCFEICSRGMEMGGGK